MHEAKAALRTATRNARRSMDLAERRLASERAVANLLRLPELRRADTVLLYAALPDECDLTSAWPALLDADVRVLLPRVVDNDLEIATAADPDKLDVGRFGIREPGGRAVPPTDVDVAVIPALAFDRRGNRLGMGRGFYDRFLPHLRPDCLRVGFAFSCQMAVRVPAEHHDEPVDVVVTENAVHRMTPPPPTSA